MVSLPELFLLIGLFIISSAYSYMKFGSSEEEEGEEAGTKLPLLAILCGICLVASACLFELDAWMYPLAVMAGLVFGFFVEEVREFLEDLLGEIF